MESRIDDAAGNIDYDAIKAHAARLRDEATDAFWRELGSRVAILFARLRPSAAKPGRAAIAQSSRW